MHVYISCSSDESSGEYSGEPRSPREYYKAPAAMNHRIEVRLLLNLRSLSDKLFLYNVVVVVASVT